MLRSTSYSVIVPGAIRVGQRGGPPTTLLFKGPLGKTAITVSDPITFRLAGRKLSWTRRAGDSRRLERSYRIQNNCLKKLITNIFSSLLQPERASFQLIGRGYRVTGLRGTRCVAVELGYTNKRAVAIPSSVNVFIRNRYNFGLSSVDAPFLRVMSGRLRSMRAPNSYTAKGVLLNNERVLVKQGKKTQY